MDTKSSLTNADNLPQREREHADPAIEEQLNPNHMAGQNVGPRESDREVPVPTAFDVKEIHRALHDFADDDLKQIPIVREGARLEQGATYLDLASPEREEFTALGSMVAEHGHCYVPKDRTPYTLWNRLRGTEKPEQPRGHIRHPEG